MASKKNFLDINGNPIEDILCAEEDSHGLMCPEDKLKLANIEEGANKTIVDSSLDPESTNPVQNKIITEAIKLLTIEEIDAICGVDDTTALVNSDYLNQATDSEGNILTDSENNIYVF